MTSFLSNTRTRRRSLSRPLPACFSRSTELSAPQHASYARGEQERLLRLTRTLSVRTHACTHAPVYGLCIHRRRVGEVSHIRRDWKPRRREFDGSQVRSRAPGGDLTQQAARSSKGWDQQLLACPQRIALQVRVTGNRLRALSVSPSPSSSPHPLSHAQDVLGDRYHPPPPPPPFRREGEGERGSGEPLTPIRVSRDGTRDHNVACFNSLLYTYADVCS